MPFVRVVAVLIVPAVLLGLINRYLPMAGSIKSIFGVVLWLLNIFGLSANSRRSVWSSCSNQHERRILSQMGNTSKCVEPSRITRPHYQ